MKSRNLLLVIILSVFFNQTSTAQKLKSGFDKREYIEMLKITTYQVSKEKYKHNIPYPEHFKMVYRSSIMGLDNRWDLWINDDSIAVISIRGTNASSLSWLANFYSAMVPAQGELILNDSLKFNYHVADNPKATVHVGWLAATGFLANDIIPKIDSCYKKGIKNYILLGHSQGGGIDYLLTAHLYDLIKRNILPNDIRLKTYCSAAPKPGNLYFAYDYESTTAGGWAFNIVNTADWVPETPLSIQIVSDINTTNPFTDAKKLFKRQKFPVNLVLKHVYNKLNRPSQKAHRQFEKYLGSKAFKFVHKSLPQFIEPKYANTTNYTRAGNFIILKADEAYYKLFPDSKDNIFVHHFIEPYLYLTEKLP